MEVLADRQFRAAIAPIGGMHEAVHEFIRITTPTLSSIRGVLRRRYEPNEMGSIPLAVQLMGGDPIAMAMAARELVDHYGPPRIDLNCGCPARRVNGRGAGASLLKEPRSIYNVLRAMVEAVEDECVVSVKMRSGYDDIGLFEENVRAAMTAGARMVTIHPRTKIQGYRGRADWGLIERAKRVCGDEMEVVGNGDVKCAEDAVRMLEWTGCDQVMVGRGAVGNPWIFWEIREMLGMGSARCRSWDEERGFWERYLMAGRAGGVVGSDKEERMKIGRLKMMVGFATAIGEEDKRRLLKSDGGGCARVFLEDVLATVGKYYG